MSKNALDHVVLTDDDGTGTTGTVINNLLFDQVQDEVDEALQQVIQTKSGGYTVLSTDDAVICTAALTLTLYTAVGFSGRRFEVINSGAGDVTLDGNAAETINGAATLVVKAGARVAIRSNGANWFTCTDTPVGIHDFPIPAAAIRPHASGGCGVLEDLLLSSGRYVQGLPFDPTSIESASFQVALPRGWNKGTVTAVFHTMNTAGGSGAIVFQLAGVSASDDDTLDAAVGTFQTATDTILAAKDLQVSPETAAITLAGSPASGDLQRFVVQRDPTAGGDTYASDVYLLGVVMRVTMDAAVDG